MPRYDHVYAYVSKLNKDALHPSREGAEEYDRKLALVTLGLEPDGLDDPDRRDAINFLAEYLRDHRFDADMKVAAE